MEMRERGVPRRDVALKFRLTGGRIALIEREAAVEKSMAERRVRLRAEIRDSGDRCWIAVVELIPSLRFYAVDARRGALVFFFGHPD